MRLAEKMYSNLNCNNLYENYLSCCDLLATISVHSQLAHIQVAILHGMLMPCTRFSLCIHNWHNYVGGLSLNPI